MHALSTEPVKDGFDCKRATGRWFFQYYAHEIYFNRMYALLAVAALLRCISNDAKVLEKVVIINKMIIFCHLTKACAHIFTISIY